MSASISQINQLAAATWPVAGTVNIAGKAGQFAYVGEYKYQCISENTWRREVAIDSKQNIMLGDVDDSAGDLTFVQLNNLFPNALLRQEVRGINNLYIKCTSSAWEKIKRAIV